MKNIYVSVVSNNYCKKVVVLERSRKFLSVFLIVLRKVSFNIIHGAMEKTVQSQLNRLNK